MGKFGDAIGIRGIRNSFKLRKVEKSLKKAKDEFIAFLPEQHRKEFDEKSYIGGGAIYSLYNGEEPKDYDFFVTDENLAKKLHMVFSLNPKLKFRGGIKVGDFNGHNMIVTDNAVSIGKFQIITRWVGTPQEVISNFDFKHNMYYYINGKVHTLAKWEYLDDNKLRFNDDRPRDICGCIIRTKKFIERGFQLTNKEMARMLLKLNEVGFNEREMEILRSYDEERNNFGS